MLKVKMELSPEKKNLLVAMGAALLQIQCAEMMIRLCMTFVLQKNSPLTLETLQRQQKKERKKTLGYFLGELRKRASIASGFDVLLEKFLENRNKFVHHVDTIPGWGFDSEEEIESSKKFIHSLIHQSVAVINVFTALARSWQEQNNMPDPEEFLGDEFLRVIDKKYKPLVDEIFREKEK